MNFFNLFIHITSSATTPHVSSDGDTNVIQYISSRCVARIMIIDHTMT